LQQEQQNGHGYPVSSETSVDRADRWGFVRRRDGGHLIPAISGFHTFFDEFQHLSAHMRASIRRRRHHHDFMRHRKEEREKAQREAQEEHKQEEANKKQQQQQRDDDDDDDANNVSGSSSNSGSGSDGDEDSSKSKLVGASTGDDGAFVMPPARSSKSRWTWLLSICVIVIGVMLLSKFIGHFTAPRPAHKHEQQSGKHGNALAEMNVVRSNATGDGTAPLSVRDWGVDSVSEGGSDDDNAADEVADARPDVPSDMDEPADEEEESADERMHELSRYVVEKRKNKGSANMDKGSEKAAATGVAGPAAATSLNKKSRTASPRLAALSSSILAEQKNHSVDNSTDGSSDNDSGSALKVKRINGIDDQNKKATPRKGAHPPAAKADTDHGEAQEKELHHELQKQIEQKKRIITVMALMGQQHTIHAHEM
jgi:hypothetical protein